MPATTDRPPKPDPADDRPPPGDAGTPQRPPPRAGAAGSPGSGEAAERAGRDTALLADVPRPAGTRDADAIRRDAADRGIAAAVAGIDIVPNEDR